jgi:hypothetical protein
VNGTERFITQREGSNKAGIELRNGVVNLSADSVYFRCLYYDYPRPAFN